MSASLTDAAKAPATVVQPLDAADTSYEVRLCASADDLLAAHRLRCEVFHKEQGFPLETEIDEFDPVSAHFLALATAKSTGKPSVVGTIRWVPYPFPDVSQSDFQPGADKEFPIGPLRDEATVAAKFHAQNAVLAAKATTADGPKILAGGKLTRLAVSQAVRGQRIGELLVRESEKWVLDAVRPKDAEPGTLHSSTLAVSSQMQVINFYKRLSYMPVGEQYMEEGAPHQRLEKIVVF